MLASIDLGNGLVSNRRQAIIWTNVDEDIWHQFDSVARPQWVN